MSGSMYHKSSYKSIKISMERCVRKGRKWLVYRFRGFWANSMRQNWPAYLIVLIIFATGFTAGALGVQKLQADQVQELSVYLDRFMQQAGMIEIDQTKALKTALYNDIVIILAVYLFGLTIIGIPVMLGIIFVRGFALGFTVGFLASEKSIQGLVLAFAAILPPNIFLIPALLIGGVASFSFALLLVKRFYNSKVLVWPSFIAYSSLMFLVMLCSAGAGLVEVYFTPFLVKVAASLIF